MAFSNLSVPFELRSEMTWWEEFSAECEVSLRALNICWSLAFPLRFFQVCRWLANAPCKSVAWCLLGERLWSQEEIWDLQPFSHWGCNVQLLIDLLFSMSAGWTLSWAFFSSGDPTLILWSPGSMVCRASNRRSDARSPGTKAAKCRSLAVISDRWKRLIGFSIFFPR